MCLTEEQKEQPFFESKTVEEGLKEFMASNGDMEVIFTFGDMVINVSAENIKEQLVHTLKKAIKVRQEFEEPVGVELMVCEELREEVGSE